MLYLWALRWSVARGQSMSAAKRGSWHWSQERAVTQEGAPHWLYIYRRASPNIKFLVARKRPIYRIEKESTR